MVGAARVYAEANQGVLVTPFMLATAGDGAGGDQQCEGAPQTASPRRMAGMAFVQLVLARRAGA